MTAVADYRHPVSDMSVHGVTAPLHFTVEARYRKLDRIVNALVVAATVVGIVGATAFMTLRPAAAADGNPRIAAGLSVLACYSFATPHQVTDVQAEAALALLREETGSSSEQVNAAAAQTVSALWDELDADGREALCSFVHASLK